MTEPDEWLGLEPVAKHSGGPCRLQAQGPPVLVFHAEFGELYRAPGLQARGSRDRRSPLYPLAGRQEPDDPPLLAHPPPAARVAAVRAERAEREGPLPPVLHAAAGAAGQVSKSVS